ncbi:MAG: hypothetical protein KJ749_03980 [Planctomycetes bacterium]|nr:hypothetical protein [Planctomycetota bacterium]
MAKLPFEITARHTSGSSAMFIAIVDGKEVATERYSLGASRRRHETARKWAADKRLCGNSSVTASDVEAELEALELRVKDDIDSAAREESGPVLERASYVDDAIIAELTWNWDSAAADFIVRNRETGETARARQLETASGIITPPAACDGIVTPGPGVEGAALLPSECDQRNCDDARLRRDIRGFIERYVELPGASVLIAVVYVLLTWVYDAFAELAYLGFRTADVGRGKSRALETVGTLCYRPLVVGGGSSAAATLRMLNAFGGTLLADEFDRSANTELGADLNRILNQGFQRQRPLIKCDGEDNAPRPFRCFGPKIFALRQQLGDDATESRTIFIHMQQRTRSDVPICLPHQKFHKEALAIRNRLLAWRFANLGKIKVDPRLAAPELEDRANQIGLPLLAVARSDAVRAQIVAALKEQQGAVAADRADSLPGAVFEAVLAVGEIGDEVRPGAVA